MQHNPDALRAFFGRVTPAIPELFNMAYAICGNFDMAEYALGCTLMEAWNGDTHGGMGFREGLRNSLRRLACEAALGERGSASEMTWDGLCRESDDPVLKLLAGESVETRRAVALRYGCSLPVSRIARLTGLSQARVKELLGRFERAAARRLPPQERRRAEQRLTKTIRREFDLAGEDMPSPGLIFRAFEAEASETRRPRHLTRRIIRRLLAGLLAVLCALLFWLAAVLIQPAQAEAPAVIVTEEWQ